MGKLGKFFNENPQHLVRISRDFYLGKHEITNAQFRAFRPDHDSLNDNGYSLNGKDQPVVHVSWNDAIAFCDWLSEQSGKKVSLPSEAEWEYACRAGTTTRRYWGDDLSDDQACPYENVSNPSGKRLFGWDRDVFSCEDGFYVTAPVGLFHPNDFGLYDLLGNAWEWCYDRLGAYSSKEQVDPVYSGSGTYRVLRGGNYSSNPSNVRSAFRNYANPNAANEGLGFRVVVDGVVSRMN